MVKSDNEWMAALTPEQYGITRLAGTERPFTGAYVDCKTPGTYLCVCCGEALFASETKYDSRSGWPSFWQPVSESAIGGETDNSNYLGNVPAPGLGQAQAFGVVEGVDGHGFAGLGAGDQVIEIAVGVGGPDLLDNHGASPVGGG